MFVMRTAVKAALKEKRMTMTELSSRIGKDRASLTDSLYNGNPVLETVKSVAYELGYTLSEFIKLGEE